MASLEIVLLGGFQARAAGKAIDLPGRKERALLALLAMPPGEPRTRDKLAGLLWSDRADNQARDSLKQAVFKLKKSLDGVQPSPVRADREFVSLDRAVVTVDVAEFERLIGEGTPEAVARASALYRGDLLDGVDIRDAAFDEWLLVERQRLRDLAREAMGKTLDRHVASGAHDQAGAAARRLLTLDPLRESAHRALMQIYAEQGQTALALKQYQLCRDALQSDLGVRPEAETERLYRSIQEKRATARRAPDRPLAQIDAEASPPLDASPPVREPEVAKPSIAVLPFVNLSADAEQEFFVDGLTDDIITALSRISALWVIARGSTFTYKGKPTDVKRVAQELGVRYVMEGSVRRAGERLRVTAQLIDATAGHHVWAERYDRPLADLFDIQDEITRSVAASTETQVALAERRAAESRPSGDFRARDLVARAWAKIYDQTPEAIAEASDLVEEAIRIDPTDPRAHVARARVFVNRIWVDEMPYDAVYMTRALELARIALRLAPGDEYAHLVMAWAWAYAAPGRLEDAIAECERGLEINPNSSLILGNLGFYLAALGRSQEAIEACRLALRLNPRDPSNFWRQYAIAVAHFAAADYAAALQDSKRIARSRPHLPSAILWAAAAAALDKADEARSAVAYCLARRPNLSVDSVAPNFMLRFARDEDHERLLDLLRKAGLPSEPPPRATSSSRPSIAVLPFANLSGDPGQEYFADGIVEDIISGLTRLHWLFVIARDSSFVFKGKAMDIKRVGRALGVRYLLEGSVRKAGDRVRIASELIDAESGAHIWADHFDGALSDIFDLQDRITASVVGAIEPKLRSAEIERARRKPTESVDAYDLFLRALALNNTRKKEDNKDALRLLYRAVDIDPRYAAAYALAGYCYVRQYAQLWVSPSDPAMAEGIRMARLAAEYGQDDPESLWMAGVTISVIGGDADGGLALIDRALALNPNSANALMVSGLVRAFSGKGDAAMTDLERSRRLSPLDPIAYGTSLGFAWAHFMAGRYAEAAASCDRTLHEAPTHYPPALTMKIVCCGLLGRLEEGRKGVERLLAVNPEATLSRMQAWYRLMIKQPDILDTLLDGLRKAGLPSEPAPSSASAAKPAIAVLPFTNLSGDPEQQYFSDGLAEDIITELSRYRSLLVIARNSCFQFRGPSIDIAVVRSRLGVRYVVEGSVRRVGARLHLTARLIDALTESHVWAERYDRDVGDIFAIQDEMTRAIAATLEGRVAASGAEQARRRPTTAWQAYDHFLRARELGHRYDFVASEPYFARAIELDPKFAQAHAWRVNAFIARYWNERRAELLDEALQSARMALSLDDADAWCHLMMGFALSHKGQLDLAGPHFERALALNPTDVQVAILRAWWLARVGRTDEAIEALDVAMHRDPFPPQWLWECRAIALMQARRYDDAIDALGRATKFHVWAYAYLAACYARLDRAAKARAAVAEALRMDPQFSVRRYGQLEHFKNPADHEHLLNGMRMAGLPE